MGENFVIHGPKLWNSVPEVSLGKQIYESFLDSTDKDVAFIDHITGKELFHKQLFKVTCRLAVSINNCGYNEQDIICVCSENHNNFFVPVIAGLYLGIPIAPINQNFNEGELAHALNISKPKVIFCSEKIAQTFLKLNNTLEFIERIILIEPDASFPGIQNIEEFIQENCGADLNISQFRPVDLNPFESVATVLYSSGTTGLSKGVMLTHDNLSMQINQMSDPRLMQQAQEVVLGILPFFHAYGFMNAIGVLITRNTTIVVPKFDQHAFLSCTEKYKISRLWLVPPLMIFLARSPIVSQYNLSSIVELSCGAAPLSRKMEAEVRERFPNLKTIRQGYGLTETTLIVLLTPIGEVKTGSAGKVVPGMSCFVRDIDSNKHLGPHQIGELCFKGRLIMKGYYQNPEATKNTITHDGWLHTGDIGYYDEDEYFYVVDRLKELIKYKAFQVPPAELEALLLTHPKIKDAAVIGVPDDLAGEVAMAFVVADPSIEISEKEIVDFIASRVSKAKHLHGGVKFVTEIPKNPSGKILRKKLRESVDMKTTH